MSTSESIANHHRRWSDLPLFTRHQWVASDEDIAAWSDILYMRGLVDAIEDTHALRPEHLKRGLVEFDVETYLEPWPHDRASDLLAAWRDEVAA